MRLSKIPLRSDEWLQFISERRDAGIFHHPAWTEFLAECYGYVPGLLALFNDGGHMQAGLPIMEISSWLTGRRAVSLPFSDFCPPLSVNDTVLSELVDALKTWRLHNRWPRLQVRSILPLKDGVYADEKFYRHLTPLKNDVDQVYGGFRKSQVHRHIRQAEKQGVTIRWANCWEDVNLFYRLHIQTRRRLGAPVQPKRFFRILWERLVSQGLGFVLLAYDGQQLLAGAVFLHYNQSITYKFGASNPNFWKLRPNDLIFWHALRWGCENGYQVFDWGRTDLDNEGLREFKKGWGSMEHLIHYSILSDRPPLARDSSGAQKKLAKMVIQHSPDWVCRLIGELFYVHSA